MKKQINGTIKKYQERKRALEELMDYAMLTKHEYRKLFACKNYVDEFIDDLNRIIPKK